MTTMYPNRKIVFVILLTLFVAVHFGLRAETATVTPTDAVTTRVVVRQKPSTQSAEVGALVPGQTAEVLEAVPNRLKVELADHTRGYVSKRWVTETAASGASLTPASPATGPGPLVSAGHSVTWWFVFKLNAKTFPECGSGAARNCLLSRTLLNCRFGATSRCHVLRFVCVRRSLGSQLVNQLSQ